MDHPPGMGVGDRLADLLEDRRATGAGRRPGRLRLQQRGEGAPLDQLHREEGPAVGERAQLVDRHDPGVLELAADLRLLDEPADQVGVVAVLVQEDLDGQVAPQVGVAALEDRAHAAAGDLAEELVAASRVGRRAAAGPGLTTGVSGSASVSRSRTRGTGPTAASSTVKHRDGPQRPTVRVGRSRDPFERSAPRPSRSRHCGQSPAGAPAGREAPQRGQKSWFGIGKPLGHAGT